MRHLPPESQGGSPSSSNGFQMMCSLSSTSLYLAVGQPREAWGRWGGKDAAISEKPTKRFRGLGTGDGICTLQHFWGPCAIPG